jgi:hypothetical protein
MSCHWNELVLMLSVLGTNGHPIHPYQLQRLRRPVKQNLQIENAVLCWLETRQNSCFHCAMRMTAGWSACRRSERN